MDRRHRWLIAACAALVPTHVARGDDLPAGLRAQLAEVRDFEFAYGNDGFFALLRHVAGCASLAADAPDVDDWTALLERPADFRGQIVRVEGVVRRNGAWRPLREDLRELGPLTELQLTRADAPLICKVILTESGADLPIGATVRVSAVFLMIQSYYGERSGETRHAAVLVGQAPHVVSIPGSAGRPAREGGKGAWLIGAIAGGAALAVVLIWRGSRAGPGPAGAGDVSEIPSHLDADNGKG